MVKNAGMLITDCAALRLGLQSYYDDAGSLLSQYTAGPALGYLRLVLDPGHGPAPTAIRPPIPWPRIAARHCRLWSVSHRIELSRPAGLSKHGLVVRIRCVVR